jgi:hypothetical protein
MDTRGRHCPFLNRSDPRCAEHLSLHGLGQAFDHCFGRYSQCAVYFELLVRRRIAHAEQKVSGPEEAPVPLTAAGQVAEG